MKIDQKILHDFLAQDKSTKLAQIRHTYDKVQKSTALYQGKPVPYLHLPQIYSHNDLKAFELILEKLHELCDITIELYKTDQRVSQMFGFDRALRELILKDSGYTTNVPMGRFDMFYFGTDKDLSGETSGEVLMRTEGEVLKGTEGIHFKMCELNTDGSSAMSEVEGLATAIVHTPFMDEMCSKYGLNLIEFEMFDSWVSEVKTIYEEFCLNRGKDQKIRPKLLITDIFEGEPKLEFRLFREAFIRNGFECEIVESRNITKDYQCDIIYRRLVTRDMLESKNEILPLIDLIKNQDVCTVGDIRSQVVHTKKFFAVLHNKAFQDILSIIKPELINFINNHIPSTNLLTKRNLTEEILENKDGFIVKPVDYYASKGVFTGKNLTSQEWKQKLYELASDSDDTAEFIIQEYITPPTITNLTPLPDSEAFDTDFENSISPDTFSTITGLFTYNKKLKGVFVRAGRSSIISGILDGYSMSAVVNEVYE